MMVVVITTTQIHRRKMDSQLQNVGLLEDSHDALFSACHFKEDIHIYALGVFHIHSNYDVDIVAKMKRYLFLFFLFSQSNSYELGKCELRT